MLTLDELLELLARTDLSDDERTSLNEALADLTAWDDSDLEAISAALLARADGILDASEDAPAPSDDDLATLLWIAEVSEGITGEQTARAGADDDARARAAELADRIRGGNADDDGEPAATTEGDDDAAGDDDGGDTDDDAGADEGADANAEAVAASGTRVSRVNARRPGNARPRANTGAQAVALVASANVPNVAMGARLDAPERLGLAFADTLQHMSSMALRPGMRVPIATARVEFPEDAMLSTHDVRRNETLIQRYCSPTSIVESVVASGELCAPPVPRYDLPQVAIAARPVRDALPRFGSERGGSIIPAPLTLDDLDGAASFWTTAQNTSAATNPSVRKPCLRMVCGDDTTVVPYAIVQCLEIDNWNARTWPERIERFVSLAAAWRARLAESRLLTRIGALSTQVTVPQELGAARDVLRALDRAGAGMRDSHRMDPKMPLQWLAPATLLAEIRADMAAEMPGSGDERMALAEATINSWFSARNITPTWFIDGEAGQVFPVQADGVLRGWHPNVVSYLFPAGTFIFVDGGELNLGVVRDSTLNGSNDFQMFDENWEEVAFVGVVSYRITMTLCPTGASAGTVEPACHSIATS